MTQKSTPSSFSADPLELLRQGTRLVAQQHTVAQTSWRAQAKGLLQSMAQRLTHPHAAVAKLRRGCGAAAEAVFERKTDTFRTQLTDLDHAFLTLCCQRGFFGLTHYPVVRDVDRGTFAGVLVTDDLLADRGTFSISLPGITHGIQIQSNHAGAVWAPEGLIKAAGQAIKQTPEVMVVDRWYALLHEAAHGLHHHLRQPFRMHGMDPMMVDAINDFAVHPRLSTRHSRVFQECFADVYASMVLLEMLQAHPSAVHVVARWHAIRGIIRTMQEANDPDPAQLDNVHLTDCAMDGLGRVGWRGTPKDIQHRALELASQGWLDLIDPQRPVLGRSDGQTVLGRGRCAEIASSCRSLVANNQISSFLLSHASGHDIAHDVARMPAPVQALIQAAVALMDARGGARTRTAARGHWGNPFSDPWSTTAFVRTQDTLALDAVPARFQQARSALDEARGAWDRERNRAAAVLDGLADMLQRWTPMNDGVGDVAGRSDPHPTD